MADKDTDFFDIWRSMIQEWESQTNAALNKVTEQIEAHRPAAVGREEIEHRPAHGERRYRPVVEAFVKCDLRVALPGEEL